MTDLAKGQRVHISRSPTVRPVIFARKMVDSGFVRPAAGAEVRQ